MTTAARPDQILKNATIVTKIVKSGAAVLKGAGVIVSSNGETEVDVATANSKVIGVALSSVTGTAAGVTVEVALCNGGGVATVLLSSTATAGEFAIVGTGGGFENQTIGGGTTVKYLGGRFTQAGVVGDFVGMTLGAFAAGCA